MRTTFRAALILASLALLAGPACAQVKPGDLITPKEAGKVADLVSPGNLILVKQGMWMKIVPPGRLDWPPPYKTATEKYSPQVTSWRQRRAEELRGGAAVSPARCQ